MCFSGCSVFGAITSPVQRVSPDSVSVTRSSSPSMLLPLPAQRSAMLRRSSSPRLPMPSRPSTNSRRPASVGTRPAEVCGENSSPASSRSAMTLRMVAGDSETVSRFESVREPIGSPVSR